MPPKKVVVVDPELERQKAELKAREELYKKQVLQTKRYQVSAGLLATGITGALAAAKLYLKYKNAARAAPSAIVPFTGAGAGSFFQGIDPTYVAPTFGYTPGSTETGGVLTSVSNAARSAAFEANRALMQRYLQWRRSGLRSLDELGPNGPAPMQTQAEPTRLPAPQRPPSMTFRDQEQINALTAAVNQLQLNEDVEMATEVINDIVGQQLPPGLVLPGSPIITTQPPPGLNLPGFQFRPEGVPQEGYNFERPDVFHQPATDLVPAPPAPRPARGGRGRGRGRGRGSRPSRFDQQIMPSRVNPDPAIEMESLRQHDLRENARMEIEDLNAEREALAQHDLRENARLAIQQENEEGLQSIALQEHIRAINAEREALAQHDLREDARIAIEQENEEGLQSLALQEHIRDLNAETEALAQHDLREDARMAIEQENEEGLADLEMQQQYRDAIQQENEEELANLEEREALELHDLRENYRWAVADENAENLREILDRPPDGQWDPAHVLIGGDDITDVEMEHAMQNAQAELTDYQRPAHQLAPQRRRRTRRSMAQERVDYEKRRIAKGGGPLKGKARGKKAATPTMMVEENKRRDILYNSR